MVEKTEAAYRDELLRRLFDAPAPHDAAAIISYRDAADRAERLTDPDEAIELLRRARMTGDDLLAKAIAVRAAGRAALSVAWGAVIYEWADGELARIDAGRGGVLLADG